MTSGDQYRDADYDIDKYIDRTASWPDGLQEGHRFVPHLCPKIRRTSSAGDIARYERYYALARTNRGRFFSWGQYLKILGDDLRRFDTVLIMTKMMLRKVVASPVSSEISNYATASEFESTKRSAPERNKRKKRSFIKKEVAGDGESISSVDSNASLTPQTTLLKKMCTEIRSLARKTCKTVEKMSTKSKYCSACGDFMGNVKVHKKCSQSFGDVADSTKPLTPSVPKGSNVLRIRSMMFDSPARTPVGGGEAPHSVAKLTFAPHAVCRTKPFINKSPDVKTN